MRPSGITRGCPSKSVDLPIWWMFAPFGFMRNRLPMMCRLHMQYFGSRVETNRMSPSGSQIGSMSETPGAKVTCFRLEPSAFTVYMW